MDIVQAVGNQLVLSHIVADSTGQQTVSLLFINQYSAHGKNDGPR